MRGQGSLHLHLGMADFSNQEFGDRNLLTIREFEDVRTRSIMVVTFPFRYWDKLPRLIVPTADLGDLSCLEDPGFSGELVVYAKRVTIK